MGDYTRRTHIVRVYGKNADGSEDKGTYADIEVLDAVSFIGPNGEMVLNCPAKDAVPYIVDDTGQNLGQSPQGATRRSHVKKYTGKNGAQLYAEVLDAIAFNDKNGGEWILDMKSDTPYDVTDSSGDVTSTRRCHDEKVPKPEKDPPDANTYINVQRCDDVAFRTMNGHEMIIKIPSADDGSGPRANTYISNMPSYDPATIDDPGQDPPPTNSDPNFYVAFDKGSGGNDPATPFTDITKIQQGPLWWIRHLVAGGNYLDFEFISTTGDAQIESFTFHVFFGNSQSPDISVDYAADFNGGNGTLTTSGGSGVRKDDGTGKILAKDLSGTLNISNNRKVDGFMITTELALGSSGAVGAHVFVKLDSKVGTGDIKIELDTGSEQSIQCTLFTFKKGVIKAGAQPDATMAQDTLVLPGGSNWFFSVNASTLKFTPPPDIVLTP